jgi:hypothetical protein
VQSLGDFAVTWGHLGDLGQQVALAVRLLTLRLDLSGSLSHRGTFLSCEA